ncbi:MAG: Gfo/Idh/MocA family oxidoreductase [Xanthobacteraceae bacterium]
MIDAAVIGLGRWGKSLVTAVQGKSSKLRFVHGVSKEPDDVRAFATQHGFRLSTDLADALADREVQAVFLATPHSLHVPQIEAVTRAGKPVWCEKPLALTRKDAERAVAACRKAGVPLGSGNNKRCFASMRELKRLVDGGMLGDILHIEGHFSNEHSTRVVGGGWRDDPRESPGGGLTGAGLHVLDALINLGGPMRSVDAKLFERKAPPDPRDVLAVLAEFASGATGMMATVRAAPMFWRVHVFGTRGMAEARDEDTLIVGQIGETPQTHVYDHVDSLKVLAEAFADAVEGRAPFPVAPTQMLDLIGAFEAIITSLATRAPAHING